MTQTSKIAIVHYGMGNISSVAHALDSLGVGHFVCEDPDQLSDATGIILPGVGAFGAAMEHLTQRGFVRALTEKVVEEQVPFLGICLGLQLLAQSSDELGHFEGFGWIDGHVKSLPDSTGLRVPHVGWSNVHTTRESPLFDRIDNGAHFYFDHSYYLECEDALVPATVDFGAPVVAAIQKAHIFATQFHPEKSQRNGLKLLRGFANYVAASREVDATC